jgi:hypothetical protein
MWAQEIEGALDSSRTEEQLRDEVVAFFEFLSHGLHARSKTLDNDLLGGSPGIERRPRRLLYAGVIDRDDLLTQSFDQLGRGIGASRGRRHLARRSCASLNPDWAFDLPTPRSLL